MAKLIEAARARKLPVIVDPARIADYGRYQNATLLIPNRAEAEAATGITIDGPASARRFIRSYLSLTPSGPNADIIRLADILLDPARSASLDIRKLVDTLPADALCRGLQSFLDDWDGHGGELYGYAGVAAV